MINVTVRFGLSLRYGRRGRNRTDSAGFWRPARHHDCLSYRIVEESNRTPEGALA